MIDIPFIQKIAGIKARRLPFYATIDGNDLAQEAIACILAGRNSITGPMQDLMRRQGFFGDYRGGRKNPVRVRLEDITNSSLRNDGSLLAYQRFVTRTNPETILLDSESVELPKNLKLLISEMSERSQLILKLYYTDDLTCKKIGKKLHISESRVFQIKEVCLRKLRDAGRN